MVPYLRIHLLGDLELWRGSQIVLPDAWPGRKTCQLFKILVTYRRRTVASDELIEWLWPDLSPDSAHNSLWVAVNHLRRLLEPEATGRGASSFILTELPGYRFDPGGRCQIDVDAFLDQAASGREQQRRGEWTAAINSYLAAQALYRGDYLAEDPYADWAIPTRERLRETLLELKDDLAGCYLALGRYQEALDQARQVLDDDPCHERAWRLLNDATDWAEQEQDVELLNDAQFTTGQFLTREGRPAEARGAWQELLTHEQTPLFEGEVKLVIAMSYVHEDDYATASAALDEIVSSDRYPDDVRASALVGRAHALRRLNRWADAVALLDQAIDLRPGTRTAETAARLRSIYSRQL